jgi:hypothetical protein
MARELTKEEHSKAMLILTRAAKQLKKTPKPTKLKAMESFTDGESTVVFLLDKRSDVLGYGFSKFNPNDDEFIPERGEVIAFSRAVRNWAASA